MNQPSAIQLFRDLMDMPGVVDEGKISAFGMAFRCFSDDERAYPNQPSEDYGVAEAAVCRTRCANFLRQWADDIEGGVKVEADEAALPRTTGKTRIFDIVYTTLRTTSALQSVKGVAQAIVDDLYKAHTVQRQQAVRCVKNVMGRYDPLEGETCDLADQIVDALTELVKGPKPEK